MTRYDGRTTSLRMGNATTTAKTAKTIKGVFDGTNKIKWDDHQYNNDATTGTAKIMQTMHMIFSNHCL